MTKEVKNTVEVLESRELLGVDFKIYGTTDEPLFLANDVKEWIGHSNVSVMIRNVDEDEKVLNNVYTLGGNQEMLLPALWPAENSASQSGGNEGMSDPL